MRKMTKYRVAALLAVVGVVAASLGIAAPAQAHNSDAFSTSFVDGGGVLYNDFGDHYNEIGNSLCHGCANSWNTDTVILWQAILAAEGLLSHSGIDGKFGPGTAAATREWQSRYGLTADGWVGPATWRKADDRLRWGSSGHAVYYDGWLSTGKLYFDRGNTLWAAYDDGAYRLNWLGDDDRDHYTDFEGSHHIHHFKRTVTVDNWR